MGPGGMSYHHYSLRTILPAYDAIKWPSLYLSSFLAFNSGHAAPFFFRRLFHLSSAYAVRWKGFEEGGGLEGSVGEGRGPGTIWFGPSGWRTKATNVRSVSSALRRVQPVGSTHSRYIWGLSGPRESRICPRRFR